MKLQRNIFGALRKWKSKKNRKPLVLQGVRQVGKTTVMKEFGNSDFENTAYFNFEQQKQLKQFFEKSLIPKKIIEKLSLINGHPIESGKTLLIFDEIQECTEALNSLKYFHEEAPEYHIICAGSLLGVAMVRGASFPVGKVDFMQMYPLRFSEFLQTSDPQIFQYLESIENPEPIPDLFFDELKDQLKKYFISGGMPEAASKLISENNIDETNEILQNILTAYRLDFSKHVEPKDIQKIGHIWNSLPSQLSRENKKFLYQTIKTGARAREYEDALSWLVNAGLIYKIYTSTKPSIPQSAYDDLSAFKVYLPDVGLLRRLALLEPTAFGEGNRLFTEFKGALTENFILTGLTGQFEGLPRYWRSGNKAEIDFLLQYKNRIIPIEVKSEENVRSKSLSVYRNHFNPDLSIRFSMRNIHINEGFINIPLFMVDYTEKLISYANN